MSISKYFYKLFIITAFMTSANTYSQSWFGTDDNWREDLYEKYDVCRGFE